MVFSREKKLCRYSCKIYYLKSSDPEFLAERTATCCHQITVKWKRKKKDGEDAQANHVVFLQQHTVTA